MRKRRRTTTTNKRRRYWLQSAGLAALLLACALTLPAQNKPADSTRMLQGIVFDPDGTPAVQAVVQLKDSHTLQVISFITQKDGAYHFAGLKQDSEYQVRATHTGFSSDWKRLSIFDIRKVASMNLKLEKKDPEKK